MSKDESIQTVLMVCTGNTCRSPMAAGLARLRLGADSGWAVASAGLMAGRGLPATAEAVAVMKELGVDISAHASAPFTSRMAAEADVVLVMTGAHLDMLLNVCPAAGGKAFLIDSFGLEMPRDVEDPIGGTVEMYRDCRNQLDRAIGNWILHVAESDGLKRK